jgi:nucleoid DNA-binding protein
MNKDDLTEIVYRTHGGMSYLDSRLMVDLILTIIKERLARGEKVVLSGFGTFRVASRRDRKGVNPRTGGEMLIRGRKAISFKPSRHLRSL